MKPNKAKYTLHHFQIDFLRNLNGIYPEREINSIFFIVIGELFNYSKMDYHLNKSEITTEYRQKIITKIIRSLKKGEPVQYILGHTEFCGLRMYVNKHVLIPRQETEELVQIILNDFKNKEKLVNILDIGTGSGCIAITLKKKIHSCRLTAIDISQKALKIARKNARNLKAAVHFYKFNILSEVKFPSTEKFDVIVSNPPYVLHSQRKELHKNVLKYEPHIALFAPGNDPVVFYKKILKFSSSHLRKGGSIYFEINPILVNQILNAAKNLGFKNAEIVDDLNGKKRFAIIRTAR